jgi:hypothetical protein
MRAAVECLLIEKISLDGKSPAKKKCVRDGERASKSQCIRPFNRQALSTAHLQVHYSAKTLLFLLNQNRARETRQQTNYFLSLRQVDRKTISRAGRKSAAAWCEVKNFARISSIIFFFAQSSSSSSSYRA